MTQVQTIPIVPVVTGEVFLQDKVADDQHCYVCKKDVDKYNTEDTVLLRISKGIMGHCCTKHHGIVQEFVKQFNRLPYGWEKHDKTVEDLDASTNPEPSVNKYRDSSRKKNKTRKRNS